jgi:hypothetical protein
MRPAAPIAAAFLALALHATPAAAEDVDLELVLAADGSGSIDDDELRLQRNGYADAIESPEVLAAIRDGLIGAIAVVYTEWGGERSQHTIVDWHVVRDAASAKVFADKVRREPRQAWGHNSISGAMLYGARLMRDNAHDGARKVIDISGDGPQIGGPPLAPARDAVLAEGIVVNGLVIHRAGGMIGGGSLVDHYNDEVIGGPGAFVMIAEDKAAFAAAMRAKLIREIAALPAPGRRAAAPALPPAPGSAAEHRVANCGDCAGR